MRLRDYLDVLRRRVVLVLVIVLAVGAVTVGLALSQTPSYQGQLRLLVLPPAPFSPVSSILATQTPSSAQIPDEAQLLLSDQVATTVIQRLGLQGVTPDGLLKLVTVSAVPSSQVLVVAATASTPQLANSLTNTFAQAYLDVRRQQTKAQLQTAMTDLTGQLTSLEAQAAAANQRLAALGPTDPRYPAAKAEADADQTRLEAVQQEVSSLADQASIAYGFGQVIQPATHAKLIRKRSVVRTTLFGVLVGFPLALAVVLLLESLRNTVRTKAAAEQETGVDVLGLIPYDSAWSRGERARLVSAVEPFSPVAEAYRRLANTLQTATAEAGARVVLITSPGAGEGKTATAANLAVALSDIGRDVILVDANSRWPRAYEFLHADPTPGLAEVLTGQVDVAAAVQWLRPSLGFLASGAASIRLDLALNRADLAAILRQLRRPGTNGAGIRRGRAGVEQEDPHGLPLVLVDAGPVLAAGEVSGLAASLDAVLLVIRAGSTTTKGAALAAEQVHRAGGRLLGSALVGLRSHEELGLSGPEIEYRPPKGAVTSVGPGQ